LASGTGFPKRLEISYENASGFAHHLASGTGFPKRIEIGYVNASGLAAPI